MTDVLGIVPNWQSANRSTMPMLGNNDLHVWWFPLSLTDAQQSEAHSLLSDIQRDRYARRRDGAAKDSYLAGRYYLLHLLAAYTQTSPDAVELSYSRMNKPYLSDPRHALHFNFTDTQHGEQRYGVFAFCNHHEVGVDIESFARRNNFNAIAANRFTALEQQFVTRDGEVDVARFLAIWTRKEAFGKATGKGINFQMNEQDLSSDQAHTLNFFDGEHRPWRLHQLALNADLIAAVVHASHTPLKLSAFNQFLVN